MTRAGGKNRDRVTARIAWKWLKDGRKDLKQVSEMLKVPRARLLALLRRYYPFVAWTEVVEEMG